VHLSYGFLTQKQEAPTNDIVNPNLNVKIKLNEEYETDSPDEKNDSDEEYNANRKLIYEKLKMGNRLFRISENLLNRLNLDKVNLNNNANTTNTTNTTNNKKNSVAKSQPNISNLQLLRMKKL
jgi:hypothetical protein